jgi:hypothetical protein
VPIIVDLNWQGIENRDSSYFSVLKIGTVRNLCER